MEKYIHREDPALLKKRLAATRSDAERAVLLKLPAEEQANEPRLAAMNRRGVEFTVVQVEPGLWQWRFQIGDTVITGKTQTSLIGMAAHRVQQRIDRELKKLHHPNPVRANAADSPNAPQSAADAAKSALSL